MGVVAEMSLSAGWLSVDWGVGGLCPNGLGLRSRWVLRTQTEKKGLHFNFRTDVAHRSCAQWFLKQHVGLCLWGADLLAGAGGAFVDGEENPGGADLFELSLLTGVEEDHG